MTELPVALSAEVPAAADSVQILRNVAAGVAARLDMAIDQIEEVRLTVTEAASLLLEVAEATSLTMSIRRDAETMEVILSADGATDPWPSDRVLGSWSWLVIKGLSDEVHPDRDDGGSPSIGFTKRRERVGR